MLLEYGTVMERVVVGFMVDWFNVDAGSERSGVFLVIPESMKDGAQAETNYVVKSGSRNASAYGILRHVFVCMLV